MKIFKGNKIWRRILKLLAILFTIWIAFSIHYLSTWTISPFENPLPITTEISHFDYQSTIDEAEKVLKGSSKRIDVPSFSIAVGIDGELIWSAAEGYQNIDELIPATPKTQYRIGSTSKSVTASGIALAIQGGLLDLDSKISQIENWPEKPYEFSMRQLLSHTAGIGNYENFGIASARYTLCNCHDFYTATEGLKVFNKYKMLYEPGTDFAYSTFDVNLASAILEQKVRIPFPKYMDDKLFIPLKMNSTYADHYKEKSEHFATFYETKKGRYREYRRLIKVHDVNLSYKWAGGGFISTPSDLVKLGNAWLTDTTFVHPELRNEFWTPVILQNGEVNEQEYAIGFRSNKKFKDCLLYTSPSPRDRTRSRRPSSA